MADIQKTGINEDGVNNLIEAHVVYAADDKFAEILGVSLVSLYENSKSIENIVISIFDSGINEENKKKIESISRQYGRKIPVWHKARNISDELKINVAIDRGSISQYARLFLGSVLPADYHRVLYLDCDLIVNQSIEGLLNIDLQGKTVGALKDAFSKEYRKNINLEPDDIMFNSGVMLIDLDRWRTQNIENKLLDYIRQKKGKIQQGDQGVLNYVLAHDIYCLEPKYNAVTIFFDFSYQEMLIYRKPPEGYYTETEIQEAVDNPVIIHYTTSFLSRRPWITGSKRKYHEVWDHFKTMSPWKDTEAWPYINRPGIRGIYIKLCRIMPRSLVIHLSGWLQAYVRPRKYRD